jgi:hypothetical protein
MVYVRSAHAFCVRTSLGWRSRPEMETSKVCSPTLEGERFDSTLTVLLTSVHVTKIWLKTWSFHFVGNELLTGYCTRGSARGGTDLRVRSYRWGSPASPSLATNRRQPRGLLWKLLRICTSSFSYILCSIFTLYTKIKQRNHGSEACLLNVYSHLMLPFVSATWFQRYLFSPFPALRHSGKKIVAMNYVVTLERVCVCVCVVRCIVAILIDLDIINLVQIRKRWRRNRTLQVRNRLPDCTVT